MQLKTLSVFLLTLASTVLSKTTSHTVSVTFDTAYDSASGPMTSVACSDGSHGLISKGFNTFGQLPHFPYIGGAGVIGGWNSAQCGTCWQLAWHGKSTYVVAIDHTGDGWNVAQKAMDDLTGGQAVNLGHVEAVATIVDKSKCGLY